MAEEEVMWEEASSDEDEMQHDSADSSDSESHSDDDEDEDGDEDRGAEGDGGGSSEDDDEEDASGTGASSGAGSGAEPGTKPDGVLGSGLLPPGSLSEWRGEVDGFHRLFASRDTAGASAEQVLGRMRALRKEKVSKLKLSGEDAVGPSGACGAGVPSKLRVAHSGAWDMGAWAAAVEHGHGHGHGERAGSPQGGEEGSRAGAGSKKRARVEGSHGTDAHSSHAPKDGKLRRARGVVQVDLQRAFGCPPRVASAWARCVGQDPIEAEVAAGVRAARKKKKRRGGRRQGREEGTDGKEVAKGGAGRKRGREEQEQDQEQGGGGDGTVAPLLPLQQRLLPELAQYRDTLFPMWDWDTDRAVRATVLLHVAQHVERARALVLENGRKRRAAAQARMAKAAEVAKAARDGSDGETGGRSGEVPLLMRLEQEAQQEAGAGADQGTDQDASDADGKEITSSSSSSSSSVA